VWSRRLGAGVKSAEFSAGDGGKKADHRGERAISRKPLRAGMPDDSGDLAVNTRVHSNHYFRTRGCGCTGHPAFPTPSGAERQAHPGRNAPRDRVAVSCDRMFRRRTISAGQNISGGINDLHARPIVSPEADDPGRQARGRASIRCFMTRKRARRAVGSILPLTAAIHGFFNPNGLKHRQLI